MKQTTPTNSDINFEELPQPEDFDISIFLKSSNDVECKEEIEGSVICRSRFSFFTNEIGDEKY